VVCPRPPSFLVCVAFHNFAQLPVRLSLSLSLSLFLSVWLLLVRLLLLLQRVFFSLFGLFVSFGGFLPGGLRPGRDRVCVCVFRVFLCGVLEERKREDVEERPRLCVDGCCLVSDQSVAVAGNCSHEAASCCSRQG
jgi:hypothetical protein